jgi:hypothetical protein
VLESFAKDGSKRIVPILLPKAPSIESLRLPPFLGRVQWIDMRSGVNSKEVEGLVWALTGTRPRSTSLFSFRRVLVLVAAIIILLGTPLYFGWPRIASRFGQPMQTQTRFPIPTMASAPPQSTGSAGAGATTSPAKPDSWGVRISKDATFGAPKPGGGSTIWEVGVAAARGYKDVSVYQVNDRYMTVINSADAQSAAGILRDVTTKYTTQTPSWAGAEIFNRAKSCPEANKIGEFAIPLTPGASKGKGISTSVYGCGALPTTAKPFSVEYSGTIFRGAADKGVHVFAPSTRFAWMELFKGVWINQYILLGPASVAGCNGYSFVKTPVQVEGIQIFISNQDSGCDKPVLSYKQLKNGKWSDWTPIGAQLTYAGELPALPK